MDWTVSVSTVIFRVLLSGCRDLVEVKAGKLLFDDGAFLGLCCCVLLDTDVRLLRLPSLRFPPLSLSLPLACFSRSSRAPRFGVRLPSSFILVNGFKSAAALSAAGLGSCVASALFS